MLVFFVVRTAVENYVGFLFAGSEFGSHSTFIRFFAPNIREEKVNAGQEGYPKRHAEHEKLFGKEAGRGSPFYLLWKPRCVALRIGCVFRWFSNHFLNLKYNTN